MCPAWERRRAAVVGWFGMKLFPNRLHEVWSSFLSLVFFFFTVKLQTITLVLYLAWLLWLKVPQLYYLWLVGREGGGCVIVFPGSVVGEGPLRVWSVSVILHRHPAASLWPEGETVDSQRKWLCFLFFAALKRGQCWELNSNDCRLWSEYDRLLCVCHSPVL